MATIGLNQMNSSQDGLEEEGVSSKAETEASKLACTSNVLSTLEAIVAVECFEDETNNYTFQQPI